MSSHDHIPPFPLGGVLLPRMTMPLHIFEERYKLMIQECLDLDSPSSRIEKEVEWLSEEFESLKAQEEIRKIVGGNGKVRQRL